VKDLVLELHPAALEEIQSAVSWYAQRSPEAGDMFFKAIDTAIARIQLKPETYPTFFHQTRRYLFLNFPFSFIYRIVPGAVQILALAHTRRRPGYWKDRTSD
jgi:plasmid stabilization system protein ParE